LAVDEGDGDRGDSFLCALVFNQSRESLRDDGIALGGGNGILSDGKVRRTECQREDCGYDELSDILSADHHHECHPEGPLPLSS
jgi:hypothetical protein